VVSERELISYNGSNVVVVSRISGPYADSEFGKRHLFAGFSRYIYSVFFHLLRMTVFEAKADWLAGSDRKK
jgi:hypothetical protein